MEIYLLFGELMSTSYLFHTMNLDQYQYLKTEFLNGWVYFHVCLKDHKRKCSNCKARWHHLKMDGTFERTFFAPPIGHKPQFIILHGHRQICDECDKSLREPIFFADGKKRYIRSFGRMVVDLCKILPIKQVADLVGVGWDMVKKIHKDHLAKKWKCKKLKKVRYVAIDEFAIQKGHRYMSVVLDLETGEILHAQHGKDAQAVIPFLEKLKKPANLKAIAVDLSSAYRKAIKQVFGNEVDLVHDPFHVVALVNKAIDEMRRDLVRESQGEQKKAIKGARFLLLKGLEHLNGQGLERLMALMELNAPLYKGYLLKEDLRTFWSLTPSHAETFLKNWTKQARDLGGHFAKLANTLEKHKDGLLSYFSHRISTGPLEGINNKIKVLKRKAFGFRDHEYFKLLLYFLHEQGPRALPI